jgi:ribulose-5-phosphate 4-epimerase/fuculose-1-phosphate aldolase
MTYRDNTAVADTTPALDEQALREDLAAAHRLAVYFDFHEGICNHFTARLDDRSFLLTPDSTHWSRVTASSLARVEARPGGHHGRDDGDQVAFHIHWPIYRDRPDIGCVLHTHMLFATSLTMVEGGRLDMAEQTALRFYGRIAYDDTYPGLVGVEGESEGERLARKLGDKDVLFARNHGIVVAGPTVGEAFDDLYYLERCCHKQWLAKGWGLPLAPIDEAVAEASRAWFGEPYRRWKLETFDAFMRLLEEPAEVYRA